MNTKRFVKSNLCPELTDIPPLGLDGTTLARAFRHYYTNHLGRDKNCNLLHYAYEALALVVRDRLMERWKKLATLMKIAVESVPIIFRLNF